MAAHGSETKVRKPASVKIERSVSCSAAEASALVLNYSLGFGSNPQIDLQVSGNLGEPIPWPGGHSRSVGPVAFNGKAFCDDRSLYCDSGDDSSGKYKVSAPSKFITFLNGTSLTLFVKTDKIGKNIPGKIEIGSQEHDLSCEVR